jgi:hypothetical protein
VSKLICALFGVIAALVSAAAHGQTTYWNGSLINITGTDTLTDQILVDNEAYVEGGTLNIAGNQIDGDPNALPETQLLFNLNATITGSGYIGSESEGTAGLIAVNNDAGTILSGSAETLVINPDAERGIMNKGRMEASNGGYLGLWGALDTSGTGLTPIYNYGGSIFATGTGRTTGPVSAGVAGDSSVVELSSVDLSYGVLSASNGAVLLFDTATVVNSATIILSGDNSQADVGLSSGGLTPDVSFNTVSFTTGTGGTAGQGVWVQSNGGSGPTLFNQVNFLNHIAVNLVGADVLATGTLQNTGTMSFDDPNNQSGNATTMYISGTVALTGSGTMSLLDNSGGAPQHQLDGNPGDAPDTDELLNVNNTITGTGYIGGAQPGNAGLLELNNEAKGTIQSGSNDTLYINPEADLGIINAGHIQAVNGGYLCIVGAGNSYGGITPVNNSGGLIVASGAGVTSGPISAGVTGTASIVELSSVDLSYGALTASNGGVLIFDTQSEINNATITLSGDNSQVNVGVTSVTPSITPDVTFDTVTFTSTGSAVGQGVWIEGNGGTGPTTFNNVSFLNRMPVNLVNADLFVTGTLTNTGTMSFDDPNNQSGLPSSIMVSGTVSLTGSGTVDLFNNSDSAPQHQLDGDPTNPEIDELINVNNTIEGTGFIGGSSAGTAGFIMVNNKATIRSGNDDSLVIDPDSEAGIVNTGTMKASFGGYLGFYGAVNSDGGLTRMALR